jgi:hypothetical protein
MWLKIVNMTTTQVNKIISIAPELAIRLTIQTTKVTHDGCCYDIDMGTVHTTTTTSNEFITVPTDLTLDMITGDGHLIEFPSSISEYTHPDQPYCDENVCKIESNVIDAWLVKMDFRSLLQQHIYLNPPPPPPANPKRRRRGHRSKSPERRYRFID